MESNPFNTLHECGLTLLKQRPEKKNQALSAQSLIFFQVSVSVVYDRTRVHHRIYL